MHVLRSVCLLLSMHDGAAAADDGVCCLMTTVDGGGGMDGWRWRMMVTMDGDGDDGGDNFSTRCRGCNWRREQHKQHQQAGLPADAALAAPLPRRPQSPARLLLNLRVTSCALPLCIAVAGELGKPRVGRDLVPLTLVALDVEVPARPRG